MVIVVLVCIPAVFVIISVIVISVYGSRDLAGIHRALQTASRAAHLDTFTLPKV